MSNKLESNPPTHTSYFDTFHGVRDHKKKKNIHMKVARKAKISLEEKKKEMDVPMMVESQGCEVVTSTPCLKAEKKKAKNNYKSGGRHWVMDSGCSQHMNGNSRIFTTLEEGDHDRDHITLGDNSRKKVIGLGKIAITNDLSIQNMLHVEDLCFNLLSIGRLCDLGYQCLFTANDVLVTNMHDNELIFKGFRYQNIYLVDFTSSEANLTTCLFIKSSQGWLWHRRFAHIGMNQLKKFFKRDLVRGVKDVTFDKDKLCGACQAKKQELHVNFKTFGTPPHGSLWINYL